MRVVSIILLVVCCLLGVALDARADPPHARTSLEPAPEPLRPAAYWIPGMLTGGLIGLGAGYLQEREGEQELTSEKWKKIGIWGGGGAAAGLMLGVVFAAADRNDYRHRQDAYLLLSDLVGGTIVGTVIGGTTGVIYDAANDTSEHAWQGAALGTVIGAGLGFMIGLIELGAAEETGPARITPTVTTMRDGGNRQTWLMGARGRF